MNFDWSAYLTLSEYMMTKVKEFPDEEACCRSVVSRVYYASYCLARNFCKEADNFISHSNDHKALQDHLLNHSDSKRKRLGNRLRRLHQDRKKADYDDNLGELPINKASKALTQAKTIVESLNQLSS